MQSVKQLLIKYPRVGANTLYPFSLTLTTQRNTATASEPVQKGKIARKIPAYIMLEEGKTYSWCRCGLSKKKHLCDGSHGKDPANTIKPLKFTVPKTKKYLICCCKQTHNQPFCDLTHVKTFIPEGIRKSLNIKL